MNIRTKVIISVINGQDVLLADDYDPVREFQFFIPLGGGVEFGETLIDAARRELAEEINLTGQELDFVNFHECHFEHLGKPEHVMIYHFVCRIDDDIRLALPAVGTESSGAEIAIGWHSKSHLPDIREHLVPPGIYAEIMERL